MTNFSLSDTPSVVNDHSLEMWQKISMCFPQGKISILWVEAGWKKESLLLDCTQLVLGLSNQAVGGKLRKTEPLPHLWVLHLGSRWRVTLVCLTVSTGVGSFPCWARRRKERTILVPIIQSHISYLILTYFFGWMFLHFLFSLRIISRGFQLFVFFFFLRERVLAQVGVGAEGEVEREF